MIIIAICVAGGVLVTQSAPSGKVSDKWVSISIQKAAAADQFTVTIENKDSKEIVYNPFTALKIGLWKPKTGGFEDAGLFLSLANERDTTNMPRSDDRVMLYELASHQSLSKTLSINLKGKSKFRAEFSFWRDRSKDSGLLHPDGFTCSKSLDIEFKK